MVRISHLLFGAVTLLASAVTASSSVVDLTPSNFDDVVLKSGKPALVEFFAPWCGHCKNLAPTYEELATVFAAQGNKVTIAKVDADAHRDLGKRFGVQGFPTLKWFDGKSDVPSDYSGGRDLESLQSFVQEKSGVKAKAKKAAPSAVEMLTDSTFGDAIKSGKDVLVAFTAPWCGREYLSSEIVDAGSLLGLDTDRLVSADCKKLAPTWEALANTFASESGVVIAKVDAEEENSKATAQANGVTSYPTIKFFPKGSKEAEPYNGGRSEADLVKFINEKAGTHRVVGGGLDALAGTIPALDKLVKKYTSGESSLESVTKEITTASKDLKDTYAYYYAKVLAKLSQSGEYAAKELARLEGMLKKGNLVPEKIDDLTSRSNVLRQFVAKDSKDEL